MHVLFEHCPYKQFSLAEHVDPRVPMRTRLDVEELRHSVLESPGTPDV